MSTAIIETSYKKRLNPKKFALWVSFGSIIMMFGSLTSAYIVKQASGNWLEFIMPNHFIISTISIILSSVFLHLSFNALRTHKKAMYQIGLVLAVILGFSFVAFQYYGWSALFSVGVDLKGNASGSFFYLITGLHALHVLAGIAALFVAVFHAFTLKFKPSTMRINRYELVVHYWHFVGILWIYLLGFLILCK